MKLETKDLMIGNILDFDGMECVVKEIDELGVVVTIEETGEEEWIDIFQFSPVPVTEEWLIKLGFNNGDWSDDKYDVEDEFADSFTYTLQSNVFHRPLQCRPIEGWKVYIGEDKDKVFFEYAHELQNIINTLKINNGKSE